MAHPSMFHLAHLEKYPLVGRVHATERENQQQLQAEARNLGIALLSMFKNLVGGGYQNPSEKYKSSSVASLGWMEIPKKKMGKS